MKNFISKNGTQKYPNLKHYTSGILGAKPPVPATCKLSLFVGFCKVPSAELELRCFLLITSFISQKIKF